MANLDYKAYEKYAKENNVTYSEAVRALSNKKQKVEVKDADA